MQKRRNLKDKIAQKVFKQLEKIDRRIKTQDEKLEHIKKEIKKMASEIDDNVDAVVTGIGKLAEQLTDFKVDFDAAIAKLQTGSGSDNTAAIAKLKTLATTVGAMADAVTTLDTQAEGISGEPTPPAV
jgi:division protein CdvB (Snf7/Vps24/ESCRT-III family)